MFAGRNVPVQSGWVATLDNFGCCPMAARRPEGFCSALPHSDRMLLVNQ
jgi:hypothetical protein